MVLFAQTRDVWGTYTYYSDPSQSFKAAKAAAIQHARTQVLAQEFGTLLTQSTLQQEAMKNGEENSYFMQLSEAEVKGEWLGDLRTPLVSHQTADDGVTTFTVTVWGKVRAINNESVDFTVLALRNGKELRHASTDFLEGDDLNLYFKSPIDGYVAVYLIDESATAYCLLPTASDEDGRQPVTHGNEYVFLDDVYVTCDDPHAEYNRLYILFSPNPFTKPVDDQRHTKDRLLPRQLSYKDFTQWMIKTRSRDKRMSRKYIDLTIRKNN